MIKARDDLKVLQQGETVEIQRIVDATKNSYNMAASREENVKELLDRTKSEVLNLNEKFVQYSILKREVDANRLLYDTLQTNIKKENITEQTPEREHLGSAGGRSSHFAFLSQQAADPADGRGAWLLGGVGLAFLIEYLDKHREI